LSGAPILGILGVVSPNPRKFRHPQPQPRSAIAQVGGNKGLAGRTDLDLELSNSCARRITNAILYDNPAISLSRLLTKHEASCGHAKALARLEAAVAGGVAPPPPQTAATPSGAADRPATWMPSW